MAKKGATAHRPAGTPTTHQVETAPALPATPQKFIPKAAWEASGGRKPGWKTCPSCGGGVAGPNTPKCTGPNCGHVFVIKARGERGTPAKAKTSDDIERDALIFALQQGGIDEAEAKLQELAENPAMAFAIKAGGIDKAVDALTGLMRLTEGDGRKRP